MDEQPRNSAARRMGLFLLCFLAIGFGIVFLVVGGLDVLKATKGGDTSGPITGAIAFLLGAVTLGFVAVPAAGHLGRREQRPFYMHMALRILLGVSFVAFAVAWGLSAAGVIGGILP